MIDEPRRASDQDVRLVEAMRGGDEEAFAALVDRYHGSMLRVASMHVPSRAVAEEVVQETWLGVLKGLEGFEGRSSLRTWIFRILVNTAKTRGQRESRSIPFSTFVDLEVQSHEPAVEQGRFREAGNRWAQHWASAPSSWEGIPEDRLLSKETLARVREAIEALPPAQRQVIGLRDVEGWTSPEVCNALEISETNQRVLLHRARAKVRAELERYLEQEMADR